jgi:hypothetical protein
MSIMGVLSGWFGGQASADAQAQAVRAKAEADAQVFAEAKAEGRIVDYEVDYDTGGWEVTVTEGKEV